MKTAFFASLAVASTNGFSMNLNTKAQQQSMFASSKVSSSAEPASGMTRGAFVLGTMGAVLTPPASALARGVKEKSFEGMGSPENERVCVDRCVYERTKKGATREEALKKCKEQCADPKAQLTSDTPKQTKGSEKLNK